MHPVEHAVRRDQPVEPLLLVRPESGPHLEPHPLHHRLHVGLDAVRDRREFRPMGAEDRADLLALRGVEIELDGELPQHRTAAAPVALERRDVDPLAHQPGHGGAGHRAEREDQRHDERGARAEAPRRDARRVRFGADLAFVAHAPSRPVFPASSVDVASKRPSSSGTSVGPSARSTLARPERTS